MLQLYFGGVHYMEPSCWVQIWRCCLLSNKLRSIIQQDRTITPLLLQCSEDCNQKKLVALWASVTLKNCIITNPTASFCCHTELINLSNLWTTRTRSTSSEHTYTQLMVPNVNLRKSWDHVNHTLTKQSWKCKRNSWAPPFRPLVASNVLPHSSLLEAHQHSCWNSRMDPVCKKPELLSNLLLAPSTMPTTTQLHASLSLVCPSLMSYPLARWWQRWVKSFLVAVHEQEDLKLQRNALRIWQCDTPSNRRTIEKMQESHDIRKVFICMNG